MTPFIGPGGGSRRWCGTSTTSAALPILTQTLLDAGWPPADVHAVLGENFLRVFGQVCG